ncbi:unnamed protein product, partial [Ectocarpus sp. 12 AP-2014]
QAAWRLIISRSTKLAVLTVAPRSPINPSLTLSVATTLPRASLMANSLSSTLKDEAMVELLLPPWRVPAPAEAEGSRANMGGSTFGHTQRNTPPFTISLRPETTRRLARDPRRARDIPVEQFAGRKHYLLAP